MKKKDKGTGKQKNESMLRSARQNGSYLVSNGIMRTFLELDAFRKPFCQKDVSLNMDHYSFLSSHFRLLEMKLGDILESFKSVLYELFIDQVIKRADARYRWLQLPASVYCPRYLPVILTHCQNGS